MSFERFADVVGSALSRDDIEQVTDLLQRASDALVYLAESDIAGDGKDDYHADADDLNDMIDELKRAERENRG